MGTLDLKNIFTMALLRCLIFLAVLEFLLASCFCANLSSARQPLDLLLENLKKSYRGEMVHVKVETEFQTLESSVKHNLIFDVPAVIILQYFSFFDKQSIFHMLLLSKNSKEFFTQIRLYNFSPYLYFKESWMNDIMLSYLNENFFDIISIKDSHVQDELLFSNINYSHKVKELSKSLSDEFVYLLRNFMHELICGINEPMINIANVWKPVFAQKILEHEMPKCTNLYLNYLRDHFKTLSDGHDFTGRPIVHDGNPIEEEKESIRIINFMSAKPKRDSELLDFYNNNDTIQNMPEFKIAFKLKFNLFESTMTDFEMKRFIKTLKNNYLFSKSFIDRFPDDSEIFYEFLNEERVRKESVMMKGLYSKLSNVSGKHAILKYIWTRDLENPFEIDEFIRLNQDISYSVQLAILDLSSCFNPNLVQIEMFRQLVRLNVYDFQIIRPNEESPLIKIFLYNHLTFFRIILEEASTPINMYVFRNEHGKKYNAHITMRLSVSKEMLELYFNYVERFDYIDLSILFFIYEYTKIATIKIDELNALRTRIAQKNLNLNSRFLFNFGRPDYEIAHLIKNFFKPFSNLWFSKINELQGSVWTFKQFLYNVKDKRLNYIFGLDLTLTETEIASLSRENVPAPTYSLIKFMTSGILEQVVV